MPLSDQFLTLALWGLLFCFVGLFVAGMTNKVVVYYDGMDLFWSLSPFIFPVLGTIIASSLLPTVPEGIDKPSEFSDTSATVIIVASVLMSLFGIFKTFVASIKHNGMTLGIIVAIFKIVTALLAAICTIGLLQKLFQKDRSLGQFFVSIVLLGAFAWVMKKLINGRAVYESRQLAASENT